VVIREQKREFELSFLHIRFMDYIVPECSWEIPYALCTEKSFAQVYPMQDPRSCQIEGRRDRERRNSAGETAKSPSSRACYATQVTRIEGTKGDRLAVLGPLVLAADLLLLLGGEVVLDVESLTDLIGRLALDHVRDGLAADIEESLDVEVVGGLQIVSVYSLQNAEEGKMTYEDDLEEHFLVDLHELLVPLVDVGRLLARVRVVVLGGGRVVLVVLAPLDNLLHNSLVDLRCVNYLIYNREGSGGRTLGIGIDSVVSPPKSSSKFLMRMERSATLRSTFMGALSEVVRLTRLSLPVAVVAMMSGCWWICYGKEAG
jgi:hypothetical protein